ncbi:SgcJ/EcaC family oxidoreductase [Spirosoma sp. BT702]|uniref:SgcJ/EcaC family oxidoreductase n=1 Tax=Spirosoma profusum TaxID=2771354 RepID=A0A926XZU6_9BACT|nr:SgcJ/EcaC family oxidoreductase [Spirosoma profusum]MBD2703306.1 SgcJ/EcaC family oxidoreductase [Spirosoma profusum]
MKPFILLVFMTLLGQGVYSQQKATSLPQKNSPEQKAIEAQVDAFFTSWNTHDFRDMNKYMAPECDFVNIVGMHWKGREDVQYAHQTMHEQHFKTIPLEKRSVAVRFLTPDVAIAHVLMHVKDSYITPDGSKGGDGDGLATFVFVKRNRVWLVEAVENVVVNEVAKPFNPITVRDQSKQK